MQATTKEDFIRQLGHILDNDALNCHGWKQDVSNKLSAFGYRKVSSAATGRFLENVDTILARNGGDADRNELEEVLNKHGYFRQPVAKPAPAKPASLFEIDLAGLPKHLQEVVKVHFDLMVGGLMQREKYQREVDPLAASWDGSAFDAGTALQMAFKNIAKGHMADASNFLMFINARGWNVTPILFRNSLPALPPDRDEQRASDAAKTILRGTKKAPPKLTVHESHTHGREINEHLVDGVKDELAAGKLHWIRAVPGYDDLFNVLALAYDQAARGKGKERHANDQPFDQQPLMRYADSFGTGFLLGQATKKLEESQGLSFGADIKEILGAIVYSSAAVLHLEKEMQAEQDHIDSIEEDNW